MAKGMALSLVYGIVESHGGRIQVQSREGEGTCVSVVLPAAQQTSPVLAAGGER